MTTFVAAPALEPAPWPQISREALRLAQRGESAQAAALLHASLQASTDRALDALAVAMTIDLLISAGRYRDALAWHARLEAGVAEAEHVASAQAQGRALAWLNAAEAHYNLGQLDAAAHDVEHAERWAREPAVEPWVRASVAMQHAWLLALHGRGAAAERELARIDEGDVLREYRAELAYTHAFACLAQHALQRAGLHAERGLRLARRPASERNGDFLLGQIAHARGEPGEALAHLQRGVSHRYRGQGGAALVLHAELLHALHGPNEAARGYQLVLERDPESQAADVARANLAALEGAAREMSCANRLAPTPP